MTVQTVLVTGAGGFIAGRLLNRFAASGYTCYALTRKSTPQLASRISPSIRLVEAGGYTLPELERALGRIRTDAVIHLASYGVAPSQSDTDSILSGNVQLIANLLRATAAWKLTRFIHTGSCFEYAPVGEGTLLDESAEIAPLGLYGAAKASSVLVGTALARKLGIPLVTLRLFGTYGPGEAPHRLIPDLIGRLQQNRMVDLTSGEQVRDFTHVDDVVDAFVRTLESTSLPDLGIYNVCSGNPVTVRTIGETVADVLRKPRALLGWGRRSYRTNEAMWLVGNPERFRRLTAWSPGVSLREGIERTIEALKKAEAA